MKVTGVKWWTIDDDDISEQMEIHTYFVRSFHVQVTLRDQMQ